MIKGRRPISFAVRVYHYLKGPNPLHPGIWNGRLGPLKFRRFELDDLEQCLEIYSLNETGRFPEGGIADYRKSLTGQRVYFLVAEKDGRVVASGGLHYFFRRDLATLCFGLVHPEYQGQGIGTALVLTRLALLDRAEPGIQVLIFAVAKSIGYYRRFGFGPFTPWKDKHGQVHPSGHLGITSREIEQIGKLLVEHGISYPEDEKAIPFREREGE